MQPISDMALSGRALLSWGESVQMFAYALLIGLALFALLQFLAAGQDGFFSRYSPRRSLRSSLTVGLTLVGTVPVLALTLLLIDRSANLRAERTSVRLVEAVNAVSYQIDQYLDKHLTMISSTALAINDRGDFSASALTNELLLRHDKYSKFLTMLAANRKGDIVAATDYRSGPLKVIREITGDNIADREYFRAPMSDGRPFISNPFLGRSLGNDPIVAISAVLIGDAGERAGIVEGSLNLRGFEDIDKARPQIDGAVVIVVDTENRVIYSTDATNIPSLASVAKTPMIVEATLRGDHVAFEHEAGNDRHHYMSAFSTTANGWKVFLRVPIHHVTREIVGDVQVGALLLLAICGISLLMARGIVRRVSRSVRDMNKVVSSLSADGSGEVLSTPANTAKEFEPVFDALRERSNNLRHAYTRLNNSMDTGEKLRRELAQVVSMKEAEIADRTAALEEANSKLRGLSTTDALTGIPNRRGFDSVAERTWRLGTRENMPVAIVIADIDFFKIYNDSLGHQAGDECLGKVAKAMHKCATRPLDLVARYGGEEFAAVLGGSTINDALVVADRMRLAVEGLRITHPGSPHDVVTVSVGIASSVPGADTDFHDTLRLADQSLYYAKAAGRNCVVFRRDDEFVTCGADYTDISATGVLQLLSGQRGGRQ